MPVSNSFSYAKSGLPPSNDKIRGTLSTAEIFVPQKKKKKINLNFFFLNFCGSVEEWQPC